MIYECLGMFLLTSFYFGIKTLKQSDSEHSIMSRWLNNFRKFKQTYRLSTSYIIHGLFSLNAINLVSIPIFLAGKRCSVVFVLFVKLLMGEKLDRNQILCSLVIVSATVIAVVDDLNNGSIIGYLVIIGSNLATIIYAEISGKLQNKNKMDTIELVQLNTQFSVVPLLIIGILNNEFKHVSYNFYSHPTNEQLIIFMILNINVMLMFIHEYYLYRITKCMEVFTLKLSANFKDIIATTVSIFIFNDINLSFQVIISLVFTYLGAFGYCFAKYKEIKHHKSVIYSEDSPINSISMVTSEQQLPTIPRIRRSNSNLSQLINNR